MWWAGSEAAQIYLGQSRIAVWSPRHAQREVQGLSEASVQDSWMRGVELLRHDGKPRRQRLEVWLSGALARPFIFEPVQGLRKRSEAVQVAAGLASEATGLAGPCEVWLDDWVPNKSCIVVAISRALREGIEASAREERLSLIGIRPWWTLALRTAVHDGSAKPSLLAVEEEDSVTVLSGPAGALAAASTYAPRPTLDQTQALLARALMTANMTSADACRATLGQAPSEAAAPTFGTRGVFPVHLEQLR